MYICSERTHLFRQQVDILFVTPLGGIVELYQGKSLSNREEGAELAFRAQKHAAGCLEQTAADVSEYRATSNKNTRQIQSITCCTQG